MHPTDNRLASFDRAIAIQPEDAVTYFHWGYALRNSNNCGPPILLLDVRVPELLELHIVWYDMLDV